MATGIKGHPKPEPIGVTIQLEPNGTRYRVDAEDRVHVEIRRTCWQQGTSKPYGHVSTNWRELPPECQHGPTARRVRKARDKLLAPKIAG